MHRPNGKIAALALLLVLLSRPPVARAEWFLEAYVGAAFTNEDDADVKGRTPSTAIDFNLNDVEFSNATLYGFRGGRWFPLDGPIDLGLAADLFFFTPDINGQNLTFRSTATGTVGNFTNLTSTAGNVFISGVSLEVIGLSADFMMRFPMFPTAQLPEGRLQPYLTAGPAVFFLEPENEDTEIDIGVKVGAGLRFKFSQTFSIFGEWRYTFFEPDFSFKDPGTKIGIKTDLESHDVVVGLTLSF